MKSITNTLLLLLALLALSSTAKTTAFTTPSWLSPKQQHQRKHTPFSSSSSLSAKRVKPAKSKEEDIELTRAIIMKHMGDTIIPNETPVVASAASKGVGNLISDDVDAVVAGGDGGDAMGKIKDIGRKIKNKIQGKSGK